ncbi:MAG TPA: tautomerase family protein [Syntrophorhabdaceae bacterium]|jgi:4-oxalocrotonate tautomerase family enzyme
MPYISIRLVGKLTVEQKETIAKEFADALLRIAGKAKDKTNIVFDEVDPFNWAEGDRLLGNGRP